jgi:hypothetical protein
MGIFASAVTPERDAMIDKWCASVWDAYRDVRGEIAEIVRRELGVDWIV